VIVKVLIVDDSDAHRSKLKDYLEEMGGQVLEASSGPEALRLYGKERPDFVALDTVMPEMDGLSTLEQLRQLDPHVKVVMVTSTATVSEMPQAREAGAHHFLIKPLKREKVEEVCKKMCTSE
jgi:two-component system chemotaxis response regulator CheY